MPTIVDFPTIVKDALEIFGDLFANAPARPHFAAYLTGLMVAERKNGSGINRELAVTTDHSCLHRWLTTASWDENARNARRLAWLQRDPKTRYSRRGVMAIDHTRVDHGGTLREDVGWVWDHANERSVIAHDSISSNSVCAAGAPYPIAWRRFKKKAAGEQGACKDHTQGCLEVGDDSMARGLPGDVPCDSYFPRAQVLNHIHGQSRAYVGDLKRNRHVIHDGRQQKLTDLARQMPWPDKKPVRDGNRRYGYFSKQRRMPESDHPVRIVLLWKERVDTDASKALVSNRLFWEVMRMLLVYRHRWTGTETFHRDGKQQLGLGECQVRSGEGQPRPVSRVSAAYSLLMHSLQQRRAQEWARQTLTTSGEACRAVKSELLEQLVDWIVDKLSDDQWSIPQIQAVLAHS
jgi:hypothetical protein